MMRYILALCFITLTAASNVHFSVPTLSANAAILLNTPPQDIATQYREDDSKGFYSYGYRGETAAKAEYTSLDGSSKGFYSYVDTDGKLQTVKYEASRDHGFKATATNLPKAPVDNRKAPLPVKDTPEVQIAKQEHFEAYREAERLAELSPDTGADEQADEMAELQRQQQQQQDNLSDDEMQTAILQNSRQQLLALMLQNGNANNDNNNGNGAGNDDDAGGNADQDSGLNNIQDMDTRQRMTTYTLRAGFNGDEDSNSLRLLQSHLHNNLQHVGSVEEVQVPVHSYITVLSPTTKYSVISPTILTSVPRIESLKLGHSLPISLSSSFVSHRISSKST